MDTSLWELFVIQVVVDMIFILYVAFFAIHAVQRVADPVERAGWLLVIVGLNVLGTTLYALTKYRKFRAIGKGRTIVSKHWNTSLKSYFQLSAAENAPSTS